MKLFRNMMILFFLFFTAVLGLFFFFVTSLSPNDEFSDHPMSIGQVSEQGTADVSAEIERYRPLFEKYSNQYGVEEYTELLMAKGMQESGGRLPDVMQSSESLGLPRNSISSPEKSIDQGIKYFSQTLDKAGGDVELALQAYNFGDGFITYAEEHNNGAYSKELAQQFSAEQERKLGWSNYGDDDYVDHVMRYLDGFSSEAVAFEGAEGVWGPPIQNMNVTSDFGMRFHPIHKENRMHNGTDFGCTEADPLFSVKDGVVVASIHSNTGLGNYITIQHNDNEYSTYGHMSVLDAKEGQEVSQGDKIGMCGTTGDSTGPHLHLEYRESLEGGTRKDPAEVLGL